MMWGLRVQMTWQSYWNELLLHRMWTCSTNLRFRALRFSKIIQNFINTGVCWTLAVTSSFTPFGRRDTIVSLSSHFQPKSLTHLQYGQTDSRSFLLALILMWSSQFNLNAMSRAGVFQIVDPADLGRHRPSDPRGPAVLRWVWSLSWLDEVVLRSVWSLSWLRFFIRWQQLSGFHHVISAW